MNGFSENKEFIKFVILDGLRVFFKNPQITVLIFVGIVLLYLFLIAAVTLVVPPEKLAEISVKKPEEFVEELRILLMENLQKTLITAFVFGVIAFVIAEFIVAGIIGISFDANKGGNATIPDFLRYGYIYTPRMVILEILMIIAIVAVILPIALIFYISKSSAVELLQSIVIFIISILLFPARFILIYEEKGVFESLTDGIRFSFDNFLWVAFILILSSLLLIPALIFPPLIVIFIPTLISLSTIWFSRYYLGKQLKTK